MKKNIAYTFLLLLSLGEVNESVQWIQVSLAVKRTMFILLSKTSQKKIMTEQMALL